MVDVTYYLDVRGSSAHTTWQTGMYAKTSTLAPLGVALTWQATQNQLFVTGSIRADGYQTFMATNSAVTQTNVYQVDELTDRKVRVDSRATPITGTRATTIQFPPWVAPMVILRPAITRNRGAARMYLPVMGQGIVADRIDTTAQSKIRDWMLQALRYMSSHDLVPLVRNRLTHTSTVVVRVDVLQKFADVPSREDPAATAYVSGTI